MSNEELYQSLRSAFHGVGFKPVTDENRESVIRMLKAYDQMHDPERR
jgi:hypothetical protein